ncbi:MAG: hypothetical protein EGR89_00060, partial [[Eubacterium] rectale]|nr:hypothetical protein [Agathobacter rectalis]
MENKIFFIIFGNDQGIINENVSYLNSLIVPNGMDAEYMVVNSNCESLSDSFQWAMTQSKAKYKVYMSQDTFIIDKYFLEKAINTFENNQDIALLGARGFYKEGQENNMKSIGRYIYNWNDGNIITTMEVQESCSRQLVDVVALEKNFIMTSVDSDWEGNNDNFYVMKSIKMMVSSGI